MIIADTSGLLALFNRTEPEHPAVSGVVRDLSDPMVVSPYVVAELDYLVATRVGVDVELTVLREIAAGAYHVAQLEPGDLSGMADVIDRYRDQHIGVTDASLVILADRLGTRDILTLDHRHFSVLRPLSGGRFRLIPRRS